MISFVFEELLGTAFMLVVIAAWRAIPLVAIAFALDLLLRRRIAARFHCILWGLVMVRLLCPFSLPFSLSIHGPVDEWAERLFVEDEIAAQPDVGYEVFTYQADDGTSVTIPILPEDASPELQAEADSYVASLAVADGTEQQLLNVVDSNTSSLDREAFLAYSILGVWALVTCGLLLRGSVAYFRFAARLQRSRLLTDQAILAQVATACEEIGVRRPPALKEVDGLTVPAVFGFWKHTICLPPGTLNELKIHELRWVLMHEIAHIKRADSLLLSFALFMRAFQWFNPFAWLTVSRIRNHMEQAADDIAMRRESEQSLIDYGRLLLRYAAEPNSAGQRALIGLLFVSSSRSLRQRIVMLDPHRRREQWTARVIAAVAIGLVAVTGLTDAQTKEDTPEDLPAVHQGIGVAVEPWTLPAKQHPGHPNALSRPDDEPEITVTYDVHDVLVKLREQNPRLDAAVFLKNWFAQFSPASIDLEEENLIVKQTARAHRMTKRLLHAWQLSGPWQITLECRVIVAELNDARGIDWIQNGVIPAANQRGSVGESNAVVGIDFADDLPNEFPWNSSNGFAVQSRDESVRSRPSIAAKISAGQARQFVIRCQQNVRANILFAPKIRMFNGQHARISDEIQRPFVTAVRPSAEHNGSLQPIIEVISEGWRIMLQAQVTADDDVDLGCVLTSSELLSVDLANLPFASETDPTTNVTVQVPTVERTSVHSRVLLSPGESLLIASPETFKTKNAKNKSMATFYMITPRAIPDDSFSTEPTKESDSTPEKDETSGE